MTNYNKSQTRLSDIKNNVGTKFKLGGENDVYEVLPNLIVKNLNHNLDFFIQDECLDFMVEVINETETD